MLIVNANMICHASASISKFIATKKINYLIDPMTHSFQHSTDFLKSDKTKKIKKSILKLLDYYPDFVKEKILSDCVLLPSDFKDKKNNCELFVTSTIDFQKYHVENNFQVKDYNKYIDFLKDIDKIDYSPEYLIAPYFMMNTKNISEWLPLNIEFIKIAQTHYSNEEKISAQIIIQKDILYSQSAIEQIIESYSKLGIQNIFLWVDDFTAFDSSLEELKNFYYLISSFSKNNIDVYNLYGSYFSTLLCHPSIKLGLSGNCHGLEYGEKRAIVPVGGGIPVNKYYLPTIHQRLNYGIVAKLLVSIGILPDNLERYYKEICHCKQCQEVIKNDLNNFAEYGSAKPIEMKRKGMSITRNYPTTGAKEICINHFLYNKLKEWDDISKFNLKSLLEACKLSSDNYKHVIGTDTLGTYIMWESFFNSIEKDNISYD
ncbi:hypothetical protein HB954_13510 [Listeria welshimeri]|nr:hypothetical protein [Listeria welshimeri]